MSLTSPDFVPLWARSPRWRSFAQQLTRYYTNRAGLNAWTLTLLGPSGPHTAWASPSQRLIGLNPQFPEASGPITLDRTPAPTLAALTETNLRAYLAHEAGHVRFSCAKPAETQLGSLWNRIEDERIERKMATQHPALKQVFGSVGDIHLQLAVNGGTLLTDSLLEWCLVWRWGHDHPLFNDRPADPLWEQVRPLLEGAWDADASEDVIGAAREILALLNVPENEPKQDDRVSASGGGSPEREEQAGKDGSESLSQAQQDDGGSSDQQEKEDPGPPDTSGQNKGERECSGGLPDESAVSDSSGSPSPEPGGESPAPGDTADQASPTAPQAFDDVPLQGGASDDPQLARKTTEVRHQTVQHEAFARVITELTRAQDGRGMDVNDRSRGQFNYQRFLADEDRQFRRRTLPTRQRPVMLTVLADTSGSTDGAWGNQTCLQGIAAATLAFARAGMLAGQTTEVYTFDSQTQAVAGRGLSPRQAFEKVQAHPFAAQGGTRLAPALSLALSRPVRDARHLVVIVSDGQLTTGDQLACQALLLRSGGHSSPHLAFLPLLVNTDQGALERWRHLFPQARAAQGPHSLMNLARSVLNSLRQGRWKDR